MRRRDAIISGAVAVGASLALLSFCRRGEESRAVGPVKKRVGVQTSTRPAGISKKAPGDKPNEPESLSPAAKQPEPKVQLTPEAEQKKAASMATIMFTWFTAYAIDHNGRFPPDTSALLNAGLGFPVQNAGEFLGRMRISGSHYRVSRSHPDQFG
jgi:hypothetical protein